MTPETFLKNFQCIVNAPTGLSRLREMIYALAIGGNLSEQLGSDGTGDQLLEDISRVKQDRIETGVFKRSPKLEGADARYSDSLPHIPRTWTWSRLVDLGEINPRNVADDETIASFAPMNVISDLHNGPVRFEERPWSSIKRGFTHFAEGDVMVAKITPCFENGKGAVLRGLKNAIGAGTTELHVVRPLPGVVPEYIYIFLRSPYFKIIGESHMTGTAGQKRLPSEYFAIRPFPLPPLEEQRRIVAKVDELMRFCDRLESLQDEREKLLPLLSRANHARIVAHFTAKNLAAIFTYPPSISTGDMETTILSLAMRGQLVEQNPQDEPAEVLLARINKTTRNAKSRNLSNAGICHQPFPLPHGWSWATFPELGTFGRGKSRHRPRNDPRLYTEGTYKLVQTGDVARARGTINTFTNTYNAFGLQQSKLWQKGTMCITIAANIADTGILGFDACIPDSVVGFIPSEEFPSVRFFEYFMRTMKSELEIYAPSTAQKNINLGILEKVLIPIPPAPEQNRIVSKVDELMELVNRIENSKSLAKQYGELFAHAAITSITGVRIEEHLDMKAPKTELITELMLEKSPSKPEYAPLATILANSGAAVSAKELWQKSGLEIDAFYSQLKAEMSEGWITEPEKGFMKEVEAN